MDTYFPQLFQPVSIGAKRSRNRIMRLATLSNTIENSEVTERTLALYRRIAKGGVGVIVSEGTRVHPSNTGHGHNLQLYRKQTIPTLARLADAMHDEQVLLIAQLNHGGRQHHGNSIPKLWAPSALACPHSGGVPHEMSQDEIADVVAGFALAALHACEAGCDGVEIHGGQGHLVQEFMSAYSNRRDDRYGGSLENRLRFASEIVTAIRDKVDSDFIVGFRLGYEEFTPGGITLEESKEAALRLAKLGVDYLSLTQGNFNTIDTHCPDAHYPAAPYADLQAQLKASTPGMTVIASTRIQMPEQAEAIIAEGKADLVGLCRALIADPEWPIKAMAGRSADIRRCIYTSQCHGSGNALSCSINPTIGNELEPPIVKAAQSLRVVVVGGGPAGLEAARICAERGFDVVLFEAQQLLGGKLIGSERFSAYHEVAYAAEYLVRQAQKAGITIRLGMHAGAQTVLAEKPDAVIIATGASITAPAIAGDGTVKVYAFGCDIPSDLPAGRIVVMDQDGYYWAASVTEALARAGREVTYVTRFLEPLRELPQVSRISTLRALDQLGVLTYDNLWVDRAEGGSLVLRHAYNTSREIRIADVGALVWLGVQRSNEQLANELRDVNIKELRVIGDAYAPRRLANAIGEGYRAGRSLAQAA